MIKKFILAFLMSLPFSFSAHAVERAFIISGYDDVLRQAENTGLMKAALKVLEKDRTFTGMPELYQVISSQESPPRFVLISAISTWFDGRIGQFLADFQFPSNRRYLRNWLTQWSIEDFKIEKMKEVLRQKPNRKFIVIFDNSDPSIALAEQIHQQFSLEIVAVYLRQVVNKDIPPGSRGFFTAFDIAANEYRLGRLAKEDVLKVGQAIVNEKNVELLIPHYAACPTTYNPCGAGLTEINDICQAVSHHVDELCGYAVPIWDARHPK